MEQSGRKNDRKAVGLLVKLQHSNVATFEEEYATNLSSGGMFIRSRQPQPIGTRVKFEVQIAGGVRVMRGVAVVRWVREPGDPAGAPGMGLQFEELDEATRAVVDRMIAPKEPAIPDEAAASAAALEAELKAQYGEPPKAKAAAPAGKPAAPKAAPAAKPAPPPAAKAPALDSLFEGEDLSAPAPALSFELEPAPPPKKPAPAPAPKAPAPRAAPPPAAKAAAPPAKSAPRAAPPPAQAEPELDAGDFDLSSLGSAPAPAPAPAPATDNDISVDFGDEPVAPAAAADEGIALEVGSAGSEGGGEEIVPIEEEKGPGAGPGSIDLSLDELIAGTPEPSAAADEPLALEPLSAAPKEEVSSDFGIDFDFGSDEPAQPSPPPPPAPAVAAKPAKAAPAPAAPLPEARRQAPPAPAAPEPPPTLARPAAVAKAAPKKTSGPVFLKPPEKLDATGPVIGIDLGTTNSCVGILAGGKPIVMRSKQGYNTLPSIVSLTNSGKLLIAHPAKQQMVLNPTQTIYGAKRLVGRAFDSPTVQQVRERFHYKVCPDDAGRAAVQLGDHVLSLEEVQGLVLRECKEMAEREMNKAVNRAVVTVPAYYSEPQREAVRKAGALAGLKVERILNEPTAAALAFGMNRDLNKKILVYDLGGGTFDATALKIEKNVFEVLATGGDTFLGGVDFDNLLVDMLLKKFQEKEQVQFSGDSVALSRVTEMAEKVKVALSEQTKYDVHIPMLMMDPSGGSPRDLRCTLTRDEFNEAALPLIERTLDAVRDVLLDAKMKVSDVDDVILVGGMSRMPLVREKLKELFGKQAQASVNPDEAVALGAALYSGSVDKVSSVVLIDVLPMTVGIGMPGGAFKRVMERNTPLPAQRSFSLPTARDNEETIEFSVFQGENNSIAGNEYLGTVRIEGLPKRPAGLVKVAVTLRLDAECVLHVEAVELSTRKQIKATLATRYTSDEVQKKLGITQQQVEKVNEERAQDLKDRGGGFWGFLKKVVKRG